MCATVACSKEDRLPADAANSRWVVLGTEPGADVADYRHGDWEVYRGEVTLENVDTGKKYHTVVWAGSETICNPPGPGEYTAIPGERTTVFDGIKPNQTLSLQASNDGNAWYVKIPEKLSRYCGTIILRKTNASTYNEQEQKLALDESRNEMLDDPEKWDAIQKKEMQARAEAAEAAKVQEQADDAHCKQQYPSDNQFGELLDCAAIARCKRGDASMCASLHRVYEDKMKLICPNGYTTDSYGNTSCNERKPVDVRIVP